MNHTPGPWVVQIPNGPSNAYHIDCGGLSVKVYGRLRYLPNGETVTVKRTLANANLIASSPELLDACRKLLAAYEAVRSPGHGDGLVRLATLAISKAEGVNK